MALRLSVVSDYKTHCFHVFPYGNTCLKIHLFRVQCHLHLIKDYQGDIIQGGETAGKRVRNIRMELREMGWEDVDWIHLAQDRDKWRAVVNTVMNLRFP
jgi:hypothetical protein